MAHYAPGPYSIDPRTPSIIRDVNGMEIARATATGSRIAREANAVLFANSYRYHFAAFHLAMLDVDASLYSSNPEVRVTVNEIAAIWREVEGK